MNIKKNWPPIVVALLVGVICVYQYFTTYEYPPSFELKNVKFMTQPDDITCGPASTTMLLWLYGKDVKFEDVTKITKTEWFKFRDNVIGTTIPEMIVRALDVNGVPARTMRGKMSHLKYYVSHKQPVIVILRTSSFNWHYVVVTGYDEEKIIVADPAWGGRWEMTAKMFEEAWCFDKDMDGREVREKCWLCGGSGMLLNIGPLGTCEACFGTGFQPDYARSIMRGVEAYPNTMIVPRINIMD